MNTDFLINELSIRILHERELVLQICLILYRYQVIYMNI